MGITYDTGPIYPWEHIECISSAEERYLAMEESEESNGVADLNGTDRLLQKLKASPPGKAHVDLAGG